MKQFYYTSCLPGRSLSGAAGFGIRAASPGIEPTRLSRLLGASGDYKLPLRLIATPTGMPSEPEAFVRLALIGEGDRLLCHSVTAGLDPSTRRTGNIFTHVLFDLPDKFDAGQAIQSWGSDFWMRKDRDEFPTELLEAQPGDHLATDPAKLYEALRVFFRRRADGDHFEAKWPEVPPDDEDLASIPAAFNASLRAFLQEPAHREALHFLLKAVLLLSPSKGRVFVVAPAPEVALYVWGIVRSLPNFIQKRLTFSTHEQNPLNCPALLIGTWWDDLPGQNLPSTCTQSPNAAWNTRGDSSELSQEVEYAGFAVWALASGNTDQKQRVRSESRGGPASVEPDLEKEKTTPLDDFNAVISQCDQLEVKRAEHLELVYKKVGKGEATSRDELPMVFGNPTLTRWFVLRDNHYVLEQVVLEVMDQPEFVAETFTPVAEALRTDPEARTIIDRLLREHVEESIKSDRLPRARTVLETLYPLVYPQQPDIPFYLLLLRQTGIKPEAVSWPMRAYLLRHLVEVVDRGGQKRQDLEPLLDDWLAVPPDQVEGLLACDLPPFARLRVGSVCLQRQPDVPETLGRYLSSGPQGHAPLLQTLAMANTHGDEAVQRRSGRLFGTTLAQAKSWDLVPRLFDHKPELPPELVDHCLAAVPPALAERDLEGILKAVRALPAQGLPPADPPRRSSLAATVRNLDRLAGSLREGVPKHPHLVQSLASWKVLQRFLEQPNLDPKALDRVTQAVGLQPKPVQHALLDRMVPVLASSLVVPDRQQNPLEKILVGLGPLHGKGANGLYRTLWETIRDRHARKFYRDTLLARDLIGAGLGAQTGWPDSLDIRKVMSSSVLSLVQAVDPRNRQVVLEVERQARSWLNESARNDWNQLCIPPPRVGFLKWMTDNLVRWLT